MKKKLSKNSKLYFLVGLLILLIPTFAYLIFSTDKELEHCIQEEKKNIGDIDSLLVIFKGNTTQSDVKEIAKEYNIDIIPQFFPEGRITSITPSLQPLVICKLKRSGLVESVTQPTRL